MYTFILFFFFNDTATTEIYTLSLHDALPISSFSVKVRPRARKRVEKDLTSEVVWATRPISVHSLASMPSSSRNSRRAADRKSTRLNSSHANISYAVFCLKKKKNNTIPHILTS